MSLSVLFFVAVIGYGMLLMVAMPRLRAGHALLCGCCAMLFAAYYGVTVAQCLAATAYVVLGVGLAGVLVGLVCLAAGWRDLRWRMRSAGLWFFVCACAYAVVRTQGLTVAAHDDFSYWARAVRELWLFDGFYIRAGSTMFHTDYIPMLASLQYCVVRVFGWTDAALTYVPAACLYASAALIADETPRKLPGLALAVLTLYVCRVLGFAPSILRSDGAMQLVFTAGLIALMNRRDERPTALLPTFCAAAVLPGFKIYSGLMFAVVLLAAMACERLSAKRRGAPAGKLAPMALTGLALALLLQLSWSAVYNASTLTAAYENARASAAYMGRAFTQAPPTLTLGTLLRGNPRTSALVGAFTPENMTLFGTLVRATLAEFVGSYRFWLMPALGAATLPFLLVKPGEGRRLALRLLAWLAVMALVYIGGLFASYLVQRETSGAALIYLATAAAPCAVCTLFLCARSACVERAPAVLLGQGAVLAAVLVVLARVMLPSVAWRVEPTYPVDLTDESAITSAPSLARRLFEVQLAGALTDADAGKSALLMDCTRAAARVSSASGKTHAYAYFALPLELTVYQYAYGDDAMLGYIADDVAKGLKQASGSLLILNIDDERCWQAIRTRWALPDSAQPVGVYDVTVSDGVPRLTYRDNANAALGT